jgi:hypothetical protein
MSRPPYKNPGFKVDKVDWRKLLLKKDHADLAKRNRLY